MGRLQPSEYFWMGLGNHLDNFTFDIFVQWGHLKGSCHFKLYLYICTFGSNYYVIFALFSSFLLHLIFSTDRPTNQHVDQLTNLLIENHFQNLKHQKFKTDRKWKLLNYLRTRYKKVVSYMRSNVMKFFPKYHRLSC